LLISPLLRASPHLTLFPYTTLFRSLRDWSSVRLADQRRGGRDRAGLLNRLRAVFHPQPTRRCHASRSRRPASRDGRGDSRVQSVDRKSTRLNSSHGSISYAVFCLKK